LKTEAKSRPDFLTSLLNLIASSDVSLPVRQAAALFFKNFVREHWKVRSDKPPPLLYLLCSCVFQDDAPDQQIITAENRNLIKSEVIALVAMVPPILQLPLGDTIAIIADTDFYQNWLNLVPVCLLPPSFDNI